MNCRLLDELPSALADGQKSQFIKALAEFRLKPEGKSFL
jgi:hypothetical protein